MQVKVIQSSADHEIIILHTSNKHNMKPSFFGTAGAESFFRSNTMSENLLSQFANYAKNYNDCKILFIVDVCLTLIFLLNFN